MTSALVMGGLNEPDALMLADTCLLWGHRLSEWCGHGPAIEEDIALTNTALDAIGQARALYQAVATVRGGDCSEDRLAYFREPDAFCNLQIAAADNGDYAQTILRSLYLSAWFVGVWESLSTCAARELRNFALESAKCARMSFRHASDWVARFGDGTDESRKRIEQAVLTLSPLVRELLSTTISGGDLPAHQAAVERHIQACFADATLAPFRMPNTSGSTSAERAELLTEMQSLARAHPEARW
jgi:ring-1,2-phenylacetyl-CoA epoxidase subunit PaaC